MTDETLWERIKQTINPLNREDVLAVDSAEKLQSVKRARPKEKKQASAPYQSKPVVPLPFSEIDRKTQRKIDKGKMLVEGKLDLHGLTVAQAHAEFNAYIKQSVAKGRRCVVVVTGKGRPEKGSGVIRRELPHWAESAEIAPHIHSFSEPIKNKGRYLILLRRYRN